MGFAEIERALGGNLKRVGAGWMAKCPAHEDGTASLSVGQAEDGRVLLNCQAGCTTEDVLANMELAMSDLFPPRLEAPGDGPRPKISVEYDYRDEKGTRLYQAVRMEPKDFRQRRPDGARWVWNLQGVRRVLYRLPELLTAPKTETVFIVEGEKDVESLRYVGLIGTTNVGGAGKWKDEYSEALRGRPVVILPDNDQPGSEHAAMVTKALTGIAASVKTVALPDLPPKGDVSDWFKAGGTKDALLALVASAPGMIVSAAFKLASARLAGERAQRIKMGETALSFGVKFLDDAIGGIVSRDLVLMGAKTGIGKTTLASMVALHNARMGKRVHYFALEAEDLEIERRLKFQIIADLYYRDRFHPKPIRFLDWYMGRLDRELGRFEDEADSQLKVALGNLHTYYRHDSFTSDDFCAQLESIKDETDLAVLDHLHYVDTSDDNENRGYKRTVKQIRDSALKLGKPVIAVAHVRKGDRRFETLIPSIEDFHGSSDVPKIATKAVMLAAAYDVPNEHPYLWNTYVQVSKCRLDGSATRYAALTIFNARKNVYEDAYTLGRLGDNGKVFNELPPAGLPSWAATDTQTDLGWSASSDR